MEDFRFLENPENLFPRKAMNPFFWEIKEYVLREIPGILLHEKNPVAVPGFEIWIPGFERLTY